MLLRISALTPAAHGMVRVLAEQLTARCRSRTIIRIIGENLVFCILAICGNIVAVKVNVINLCFSRVFPRR